MSIGGLLSFIIVGCFYFLPSLVAKQRNKKNIGMVVVVNLFFGWTILGWIIALVMAYGEQESN